MQTDVRQFPTGRPSGFMEQPGPLSIPTEQMTGCYGNAAVMVTGAGGTIGSELSRQIIACNPAQIILFEQSEAALYTIDKDLRRICARAGLKTRILPLLGSVGDRRLVENALSRNPPDAIFHSAAFKHVHLVESNPAAGVENNVFATRILAEAAAASGVSRFILVSTDKAVRPSGVMGATKRLAELAVQDLASRSQSTRFSIVRFGNVLGSSGSVVPLFQEQISNGGPVTLTDEAATRYFMTLAEAAQLLLIVGANPDTLRPRADVFVLDMGAPVRILDLATRMIASSGRSLRSRNNPAGELEIKIIGLRPGEKLHEELLIGPALRSGFHPLVLRAEEPGLTEFETAQALRALRTAVASNDPDELRNQLFRWVEPQLHDMACAKA